MEPSTVQVVRELTNNPTLESAGYLDYKIAYWSWRRDSALLFEAVHKKANEENRELTDAERASLTDTYGRTASPRIPKGLIRQSHLTFISVSINDDVATVVIDDRVYTKRDFLVYVAGRWFIAGDEGIDLHP
jgi:hypothetical protein